MTEAGSDSLLKRALRSASLYTIAAAIVLELLSRTALYVPNPGIVLILPVVYAAFREGVASGLFSAAIALAFQLHFAMA